MWNGMNIHKIQTRSMFQSPDDLIAESHFGEVAVINSKGLTVMAKTEVFIWKVNANIIENCLHNYMCASSQFRIPKLYIESK